MIQYLSFQLCKEDGDSQYVQFYKEGTDFYCELAEGSNGLYVCDCIRQYRSSIKTAKQLSDYLEPLKIYGWPKAIPADYVPSDRIMGSDKGTWALDYKEENKKTTRHIRGKGSFPKEDPYRIFYVLLLKFIPDKEFKEWFL